MINRQLALAIVCVLLIAGAALYGGIFFGGSAAPQKDRDIIFQASTIDALLQGAMDGTVWESLDASIGVELTRGDAPLFEGWGLHAGVELMDQAGELEAGLTRRK